MMCDMPNTKHTQHNFNGLDDWFTAFRGGEQTDSQGNKKAWTTVELDEIVSTSQERLDKGLYNSAPLVVGHPNAAAPSFGWLNGFKRVNNTIEVVADKVHAAFADGVKNGLWPNRSVSIGKDENGKLYLRHLGFLGAAAPAISGMDAIYNATDNEHFDYSLDSTTPSLMSRLLRNMRDFFIEKYGIEETDKVLPNYEIDRLADHANRLDNDDNDKTTTPLFTKKQALTGDTPMPDFTQADMDAAVAKAKKEATTAAQADFSQQQQQAADTLKAEKTKRLTAEFNTEITALIDAGTLLPAQVEGMAEFMTELSNDDEASFEFSSGEKDKQSTVKKSAIDWFKDFTLALGKQIDLSESKDTTTDDSDNSDFAMQGATVNADRLALHNKALEYQQKNSGMTYVDAVRAVEK